jgi:ParB-like chromosome segregation protein Spo0J
MSQKNKVSDLRQKIVYVPIDILNPASYNPRKHSERQLQNLMESIRKYGMVDPIIVNNTPERKQVVIG